MRERVYACIDLKSFYASVECVERGLDPLTTNLVVADPERTEKTICLAVSPSMKALGVRNRCRVFEIPPGIDYICAVPRMQLYIDTSACIYEIYLKYIAKEDIHVYSIDEAFMDMTDYLHMYNMSARELGARIMQDILDTTGITSTCGIGSNMFLAKVALDITAKHVDDHIGLLTEESFCETLWKHRPLTDFWRIGPGTASTLQKYGIETMGQIAHMDEDFLYRLFGVDAELLIDHANGREPTTIQDVKNFRPKDHSLTSGQVLAHGLDFDKGKLIVKEMTDLLCLDLVDKDLLTESVSLTISYDAKWISAPAGGTIGLSFPSSSAKIIVAAAEELYDRIVDPNKTVKRVGLSFNRLSDAAYQQYDLFSNPEEMERERKVQKATIDLQKKFGKNAVLKGMNLQEGGTTMERNEQIGGHRK